MEKETVAVGQAVTWIEGNHTFEGMVVSIQPSELIVEPDAFGNLVGRMVPVADPGEVIDVVPLLLDGAEVDPPNPDDPTDRDAHRVRLTADQLTLKED